MKIKSAVLTSFILLTYYTPVCSQPLAGQIIVNPDRPEWLKYKGGGPFFMSGPGDPEGFLYRGKRNADGTRTGDQISLINKLKGTGANCIYLIALRTHGGDGSKDKTDLSPGYQNPFIDGDPSKKIDMDILDQWDTWFTEMNKNGIVVYFFFYDDNINISSNLGWPLSNGKLHNQEKYFIETLVNRFEHHKLLIWCVMEEVDEMGSDHIPHASKIAETIKNADDHKHVVAIHQLSGLTFKFADDPNVDQFAIQYNSSGGASAFHKGMVTAWKNAAGRYNLNMSEVAYGGAGTGGKARRNSWAMAMGGAHVMINGMNIDNTAVSDLKDMGQIAKFFESTDFDKMSPHDELAHSGTEYILAKPGESYIAYASNLSGAMGIKGMIAGKYDFTWLDIVPGKMIEKKGIAVAAGNQAWEKPPGFGNEVVLWVSGSGVLEPPILTSITISPEIDTVISNGTSRFTAQVFDQYHTVMKESVQWELVGKGNIAEGLFSSTGPVGTYIVIARAAADISIVDSSKVVVIDSYPPPLVEKSSLYTLVNSPVGLSLPYKSSSPGPFQILITHQPTNGTLEVKGNDAIYTPRNGFSGQDSYSWKVKDQSNKKESSIAKVTITVEQQSVQGNPIKILDSGKAPNIAVDSRGDLHIVYYTKSTYKYRKITMPAGSLSAEIDVGYGVNQNDFTRSYGELVVDSDNMPHIFTGPGYATLNKGQTTMKTVKMGKRDNDIAIDKNNRILLIFRGSNSCEDFCGPGYLQGMIKLPGASSFGQAFNLDVNLSGRNNHVYCAAAAGPDNNFHVIFRHGPKGAPYYLTSSDGSAWTGNAPGINNCEGPRIAVSSAGRVIISDCTGATKEKKGGAWSSLGKPVAGANRFPPVLSSDKKGNVFSASRGGKIAILKPGSGSWSSQFTMQNAAKNGRTIPSTGAASGTFVIYEGIDGLYIGYLSPEGKIGGIGKGNPVNMESEPDVKNRLYVNYNPFDSRFVIDINREGMLQEAREDLKIYNSKGKVVWRKKKDVTIAWHGHSTHVINASRWPSGIYIVKASIQSMVLTKSVILYK